MYYLMFTVLLLLHPWVPTGAFNTSIIGGRAAKPHSRPYMASLQIDSRHMCGGFLVREDFVLTAAHCYTDRALTVVLGAHNLKVKEKSQQKIQVKQFYKHKLNTLNKYDFDVMLLKLATNATLNNKVKVIGLPKKNGDIPAKTKCTVAGWGKKHATGEAENVLQEVTVVIENRNDCKKVWKKYVNNRMICTNFTGQKGICQGDSGGPLLCNTKAQGIAAFTGQDCEDRTYPQVYMKIASFIPWINEIME
ncbi:mast cell protease 1A-like [Acipenser ruthenus]|uniref:mast cell protease 1A-like n=1 Tax=Acipenser ruthenus TaxID=7906 RepID=UPI0015612FA6|nr:mast cell protease 1A-like [Acipenser ruthenus]